MKKIKLNTNICPILSVNTYNTILEIPSNHIDNDIEQLEIEGIEIPKDAYKDTVYNFEKYGKDLAEYAIKKIVKHVKEKELNPFKLKFYKETRFYSPKEYNFIGDAFDFYVSVGNNWAKDFVKFLKQDKQWELFKTHCKNFDSCSGFISFFPTPNFDDSPKSYFDRVTEKNEDYYLSLALTFLYGFLEADQYNFETEWLDYICVRQYDYCSNKTIEELYRKYL